MELDPDLRWHPDPTGRFAQRGAIGAHWSDLVRRKPGGRIRIDAYRGPSPEEAVRDGANAGGNGQMTLPPEVWGAGPLGRSGLLALGSLLAAVAGIGLFWWNGVGGVIGIAAVALASVSLGSRRDPLGEPQRTFAVAGVVLGALAVGLAIAVIVFGSLLSNSMDDVFGDDSDLFSDIDSDPSDGECDLGRIVEDPDC